MSLSHVTTATGRQALVAIKTLVVMTLVLGVVYPLVVWAIAQVVAPGRADGQIVESGGRLVGSAIIGQDFPVEDDQWFHGRPSANDYDGLASAPSNLGPSSPDLIAAIEERRAAIAEVEGVDPADVPPDALTGSASGLDPYVSPAYAAIQVARVADARGLSEAAVREAVEEHTSGRSFGFLGEPKVDVLLLNLALESGAH